MVYHSYMSITGQKQGLISEGCSSEASIGVKCQPDHLNEITVLSLSGQNPVIKPPLGIQPFIITKYIDWSTPRLLQALMEKESLSCDIHVYRESSKGTLEKFRTLKLEEAVIVSQEIDGPDISLADGAQPVEYVGIYACRGTDMYHEEITYGTSGTDRDV